MVTLLIYGTKIHGYWESFFFKGYFCQISASQCWKVVSDSPADIQMNFLYVSSPEISFMYLSLTNRILAFYDILGKLISV